MLRGGENDALIAQIEGGIKKEVSVGCSVERCVCSICGEDINTCAHKKGEVYGGKVCCAELVNAQDAYEWSFVAVPAQPRAGVLKRCGGEDAGTLKTLVKRRGSRANQRELESLEKQAEVGKRYLSELRGEVKRLMLVCEQEADGEAIEKLAESSTRASSRRWRSCIAGRWRKAGAAHAAHLRREDESGGGRERLSRVKRNKKQRRFLDRTTDQGGTV